MNSQWRHVSLAPREAEQETTWPTPGCRGSAHCTAGLGYSRFTGSVDVSTVLEVSRWRYVKVVKNQKDLYRFGHNGQEKDNDYYGRGTHYYAPFWTYDARTGRRWNLDPKPQINISDYAAFANNPIWYKDILGDEITASAEGATIIKGGVQEVLGNKKSPIDYDASTNKLTYDDNVDISSFNETQKEVVNRYKLLIKSQTDFVNVVIVNKEDKIEAIGQSLADRGSNGVTNAQVTRIRPIEHMDGISEVKGTRSDVYIARNPSREKTVTTTSDDVRVSRTVERSNERFPKGYEGFTSIHEIIGHAYEQATQTIDYKDAFMSNFITDEQNRRVEQFDNSLRDIFRLSNWKTIREVDGPTPTHKRLSKY